MAYQVNFCETKEQLKHLAEVVTGKSDGSPTGTDIDTSTLAYAGLVRDTLPELLSKLGWYSVGEWSTDPLISKNNQYVLYNGIRYVPLSTPYQVDSTANPDPEALVGSELKVIYSITEKDITEAQNDIVGGSIFKGSNGEYVQNGDTVPSGTTHLRVLVGGEPIIVAMYPIASGSVSNLTASSADIGGSFVSFINITDHNQQTNRDQADSHTINAITGLQTELDLIGDSINLISFNTTQLDARQTTIESDVTALQSGQGSGVVGYATQADLFADLSHPENTIGYVTNDAIVTNNGTYRKSGLTGTGSWIQSNNDLASQAFQESTANTVRKKNLESSDVFETLVQEVRDVLTVTDKDGRKLFELIPFDERTVTSQVFETLSETIPLLIDSDERILLYQNTTNNEELSLRVDRSLNDYGLNRTHYFGEWYLREFRQRSRKLKLSESEQLVIAFIGDSWTHFSERYTRHTGLTLQSDLNAGDTSSGYVGFSWGFGDLPQPSGRNGNYNQATTDFSYTGSGWTANYNSVNSPDICSSQSSVVGDQINVTTTNRASEITLYANQNGANIRYRFDGGAWTNMTLNNVNDYQELSNIPASTGFTLDIEVVNGTCELYGVDIRNQDSGVIINKLGATGSRLAQWASISQTSKWKANLLEMKPSVVTILHGTNDQTTLATKSEFKENGQTLINNIRSVLPLTDIVLIAPCENGRGLSVPMTDYQDAFQELAFENKCTFLNLQHVFGDEFSEYSSTSERNWFSADLIHPEPSTGGRAIIDAVYRLLTKY